MKNQEQKEYEAPQTTCLEVELEQGFMKASETLWLGNFHENKE